MEWMILPYKRYADFNGRSQRMEYWMFTLFYVLVSLVFVAIMMAGIPWGEMNDPNRVGPEPEPGMLFWFGLGLLVVFLLGSLVPSIAVVVRRFHDQDKSGWLYLLSFIPYVGGIIMLVFMCLEGTRGPNTYGDDPKSPGNSAVFE